MEIAEGQIEGVDVGEIQLLNTIIESEAVIRFARQKGQTALLVVSPPFQQLRTYKTAVTATLRLYPHSCCSTVILPWQEYVVRSQGTLQATRRNLTHSELDRIDAYQKQGDPASFQEVLIYLSNR